MKTSSRKRLPSLFTVRPKRHDWSALVGHGNSRYRYCLRSGCERVRVASPDGRLYSSDGATWSKRAGGCEGKS